MGYLNAQLKQKWSLKSFAVHNEWNLNFWSKRSQSVVEVAKKVERLGGNGKTASATLEKTNKLIF